MNTTLPHDLDELKQCSAAIGSNRLLVQAAGGNTSIKQDGVMWIKASGTQLANALSQDIFVAVDLAAMAGDLKSQPQYADAPQRYMLEKNGLRPSIETSLHAVFPQRVVLHAHCVNTIAFAILKDAETHLAARLQQFKWAFVPYAKPGAHLAASVKARLKTATNVVVLGNHGVLVAGNSIAEAHTLLEQVHAALAVDVPPQETADTQTLQRICGNNYDVLAADDAVHQIAFNQARISHALGGSLYPDHVTFCGIGAHALKNGQSADDYCAGAGEKTVIPKLNKAHHARLATKSVLPFFFIHKFMQIP